MDNEIGGAIIVIGIILIVIFGIIGISLFQAGKEAEVFNMRFGTHYTASHFFWAGDTIKDYCSKGEQKTFNIDLNK